METQVVVRLAIALALGLVVGAERGWQYREREEGRRIAGLRTFGLVGLLGGVVAVLGDHYGAALVAVALAGLALFTTVAWVVDVRQTGDQGATTELAAVLTFAIALLGASGHALEAAAAAVVTATLLSAKSALHRGLERVEAHELRASLQLALLAVVVVPLLPAEPVDPWGAVVPRTVGLFVLLIAGISFVGYLAVRLLGARLGLLLTALFGGLTSSTAVAVAFARMAARRPADAPWLAAGIGLAAAVMAPRLLLEVAAVNPALVPRLAPGLAALALVPALAAGWLVLRREGPREGESLALRNPLQLGTALGYGLLISVLFVATRVLHDGLGDAGIYLLAVISGLSDVDAIGLSLARSARDALAPELAARGILVAALSNTAVKAVIAGAIGGRPMALRAGSILGAALAVAAALSGLSLG